MTKEQYEQMAPGEKLIYEEYIDFTKKLCLRLDALTSVMQKLIEIATTDP